MAIYLSGQAILLCVYITWLEIILQQIINLCGATREGSKGKELLRSSGLFAQPLRGFA